jgi:hypothetical protein
MEPEGVGTGLSLSPDRLPGPAAASAAASATPAASASASPAASASTSPATSASAFATPAAAASASASAAPAAASAASASTRGAAEGAEEGEEVPQRHPACAREVQASEGGDEEAVPLRETALHGLGGTESRPRARECSSISRTVGRRGRLEPSQPRDVIDAT